MAKRSADALVFADAFIKAGGIQIPGIPAVDGGTLRRIGSYVLMNLMEGSGAKLKYPEPEWFFDTLVREINRAHSEAYWFGAAMHPDTAGFRLVMYDNIVDMAGCKRFAECDNFGLGEGIFPKEEIVVLPACCDGAAFEVVFKDEIK